jgi:hypothetical protein
MTKVTRHFCKKIDDAKLKKLWPTRMTQAELAKAMGHHQWVLRRRAIKLGLPSSRKELWDRLP